MVTHVSCSSRRYQLVRVSRNPNATFSLVCSPGNTATVDTILSAEIPGPQGEQWCRILWFSWTRGACIFQHLPCCFGIAVSVFESTSYPRSNFLIRFMNIGLWPPRFQCVVLIWGPKPREQLPVCHSYGWLCVVNGSVYINHCLLMISHQSV